MDTTVQFGRQDFAPYTTPGHCLSAVRATEALAHRGAADSTGFHYHPEDTLSTATATIARRCGARFTVEATAPAELMDLAQLALAVKDDAKARAAVERYVAVRTEPEARRWALYDADTLFFHAKPRRWPLVDAMTARLDSLGAVAAPQRQLVHYDLYVDARQRYDVARLRREALERLVICQQLSAAGGQQDNDCRSFGLAFDVILTELYERPGDVSAALDRAGQLVSKRGFTDWAGMRRALQQLPFIRVPLEQIGKPAPPLVAQHWVGPQGRAPGWPVKGKVSVLLRGDLGMDTPERLALWKRLGEKYKDALDITILLATQGHFRDGPPLTPQAEAERLGRYYREQLGIPATVAVVETPMQQLPPPDGRFLPGEPPLENDPYYGHGGFLMVDRTGKVLLSRIARGGEAMLDVWIARALGR